MKKAISALIALVIIPWWSAPAAQYSKLGIIAAAKAAGKWGQVKEFIAANGYEDEWLAASYVADGNPLFVQITNRVVQAGIATPAEVEAFLARALDTAPDALVSRAYEHDMATAQGRARWHGKVVSRAYGTNALTRAIERVDTYEDGYRFTDRASARPALTPEEAAAAEAARRGALPRRIAAIRARIEELDAKGAAPATNDQQVVAAATARINAARARKTLERLLKAAETNAVTVVVSPQEGGAK